MAWHPRGALWAMLVLTPACAPSITSIADVKRRGKAQPELEGDAFRFRGTLRNASVEKRGELVESGRDGLEAEVERVIYVRIVDGLTMAVCLFPAADKDRLEEMDLEQGLDVTVEGHFITTAQLGANRAAVFRDCELHVP